MDSNKQSTQENSFSKEAVIPRILGKAKATD